MSIRNLDHLFKPKSIAVIGASERPHSVGATVMQNVVKGGFAGPIMPVNPKYDAVGGIRAYRKLDKLPAAPDLAVICTPPDTVPGIVAELGRMGTKAAVVLTAGLAARKDADGRSLQEAMLQAAKPHLLRILGPNCVGLIIPPLRINASFAHTNALPGKIAFVSQSGALTTAMLDWAKTNGIGFSCFISVGDIADVDFGDVLDYLGSDPNTRAILLYIESIKATRKFMSAARAASRNKPIIVVKAGRAAEGAKAAASHTGALAGSDDVFDAAIRRAGMLRVNTTLELFSAVETLAWAKPLRGDRLTILTNGGGPGVMATDALSMAGAKLASLSEETMRQLDAVLPSNWSRGNPVDIIGDAPVERYVQALRILLTDQQSDAVLLIHAPTAIVPSEEIAAACAPIVQKSERNVLSCWLGGESLGPARNIFASSGLPTYPTPEEAVRAFLHMAEFHRNQETLKEIPPSAPAEFVPDAEAVRKVIRGALEENRGMLTEPEAKAVLAAYGIPVVETATAKTVAEAVKIAEKLTFPVALKVLSPDVSHKSDVGGVALNLETAEAVRQAAEGIANRLQQYRPDARLDGFSVQQMVRRPLAHELIIGTAADGIFGPVILFGHGGTAVEVIADRAIALPPLNVALARDLVSRTRVAKLLAGYRDRPPADFNAIYLVLIQVSQLIADIPEIVELDINPLFADDQGVIALDARVRVEPAKTRGTERFAIRPYPKELEESIELNGARILLRPIRPEDATHYEAFVERLDGEDSRMRFFQLVRQLPRSELARTTQIDYDREMVLVAIKEDGKGEQQVVGEVRALTDPDNVRAEMGIIVQSDLKGMGLGSRLLDKIIRYCRERGTVEMIGDVRADNSRMLALVKKFGFRVEPALHDGIVKISLGLKPEEGTRHWARERLF